MDALTRTRAELCDLLDSLNDAQWGAETLCDGWDAGDVAAHLLVREREPWASAGILLKPLMGLHESRMDVRRAKGRDVMVQQLRSGPPFPWSVGPLARVQVGEDYIHAEDVRRGGAAAGADDGTGDDEVEACLWESLGRFARMTFGGVAADGVLELTDGRRTRAYQLGGRLARRASSPDPGRTVTVSGPVGDLLLFTTGRRGAADVQIDGSEAVRSAVLAGASAV